MGKIKIGLIILGSIALVGLVVAGIVMAKNGSNNGKAEYVQDEIIVKFKGDKEPFRVLKVPEGKVGEKIKEFKKRADVIYAEPNYIAYALMTPNDPYYKYQWHLDNPVYGGIQMEKAWDISTGSNSVVVAIVDTGIAYENYGKYCQAPDLANTCFVAGYDFVNSDSHPNDDNNHGTHVAGTVAQSTNNNLGVAGVAFNTCLMPVKVLDSRGSGSYANVANGIIYAADHGAKVINLSLGGSSDSATLKDAVAYAYSKGVTVVAACGNDNASSCLYPAAYDDYVIAVGATQYDETKAPYSNYGPSLDLVAPGGNTSLDQNGDGYADGVLQQTFATGRYCSFAYYFFQGTSMATPHVSGVAALLIANGNATTPDQVRTALQETAEDLGEPGRDDTYGYGLVNAYAALGWTAPPVIACSFDTDCNDNNECTNDVCVNPGQSNAYCQNTPLEDNTSCTNGICCSGVCKAPACSVDTDCNDNNACTIDTCNNAGSCAASCSYTNITACVSGDGCCPAGCTNETDGDCPVAVKCWIGTNLYLYRATDQAKKFCKCAQGTYGYNSYKYSWGRKTVWKYLDPANNENWQVTSALSYTPVYSVTCTDGKVYPTNTDYYYPKQTNTNFNQPARNNIKFPF
jgi:serine protease